MNAAKEARAARTRILETAIDLFSSQGYRATGVNEVILKAGVAKATFYHHFPTKGDLCLAYLQSRNATELKGIRDFIAKKRTPWSRFLGVIESLEPWLRQNHLRGCAFLNMVAEEPDVKSPLRLEGKKHYNSIRKLIRELAVELIESDTQHYGNLDADAMTDEYLVIISGTVALAEIYHDAWPVRQGMDMVARLVD
ncbi:MAG TPA: TetR/AcrR family transcriptional regulator [Gammaproteobacteria bacterium]|nr:TetR/AcrR family transcriptional regulator [Gammaproteobacteria bacterium]